MRANAARGAIALALYAILVPALPILISGRLHWWQAWAFVALTTLGVVLSRVGVWITHPDLLEERSRSMMRQDVAPYDRVLAPFVALGGISIPILAGLDARAGRTWLLPMSAEVVAALAIALGYGIGAWAMWVNRFFSGTMRIQTERGHVVVDTGPYHWVRHPGYLGGIVVYAAAPFLLGSPTSIVAAIVLLVALVLRTHLEDNQLKADLPGYREYAARTPFRLIPSIW